MVSISVWYILGFMLAFLVIVVVRCTMRTGLQCRGRRPEHLVVPNVSFLCEQDGTPEGQLKNRLIPALEANKMVTRAYLARVTYRSGETTSVALCLRTKTEGDMTGLFEALGKVFTGMFNEGEHFDILALNDEQEARLSKVCRPFFTREGKQADG